MALFLDLEEKTKTGKMVEKEICFNKSKRYIIHFLKKTFLSNCNTVNKVLFQHWPQGVGTHLFLLFFLLGAFFMGRTGHPAARLLLDFGAFAIFGGFGWSSIRRCFSFSTFFFFFLSFLSFFFLGLMMGPCDSAVSCSCTALSCSEKNTGRSKSQKWLNHAVKHTMNARKSGKLEAHLFLQLCQSVCPLFLRVRAGTALTILTFTAQIAP